MKNTTFNFVFEGFEDGNVLRAETENSIIQATCEVPEGASEEYGYLTLKKAILNEIGSLNLDLHFLYEEEGYDASFEEDASADADVDLFIDLNIPLYRIIDRIGDGDVFESDIYTDKDAAISDCESEWDTLTEHDKKRRSQHYVAEYDCLEDAQEVLADHNCVYDSMVGWADNLLNYTGLNRKEFCTKYNIPYGTFEKWQYGSRECPEYVKELLERVVKIDF